MAQSINSRAGSALLAVMWISAALAAIAFSLSATVRAESERASTELESVRAYFLAAGAVERATLEVLWSANAASAQQRVLPQYTTRVDYQFASGRAHVEILPEAGKLSLNAATGEELDRLLLALGADPNRAAAIAQGIVAWRDPSAAAAAHSPNSAPSPTFQGPHASFQEIEEALLVPGVTPDIFYGSYAPAVNAGGPGGALVYHPGLIDCLSNFGSKDRVDVNTAQPAVLAAVGLPPAAIQAVVARRNVKPFSEGEVSQIPIEGGSGARLRVEGNSIVTFRATAQVFGPDGKPSDLKRTVAVMVKYMPRGWDYPMHILRWYDYAVGSN